MEKRSLEFIFCGWNCRRRCHSRIIFNERQASDCQPETCDATGKIWRHELLFVSARATFCLAPIVVPQRFYFDGDRRIFGWFWYTVCRWLYVGSFYYGTLQFAAALVDCHRLFYGWRFYYGQFDFTLYINAITYERDQYIRSWRPY